MSGYYVVWRCDSLRRPYTIGRFKSKDKAYRLAQEHSARNESAVYIDRDDEPLCTYYSGAHRRDQ